MNKIKLTGWNGEEDYVSEEFEIFGIVPIPEIVGDSVEYINNVIEKKVKIRIGYQIKFPPYKTNAIGEGNTESILAKLLVILRKKLLILSNPGESSVLFPRWSDKEEFPTTYLYGDEEAWGREVYCESLSINESWEEGEETIELTLKERQTRDE